MYIYLSNVLLLLFTCCRKTLMLLLTLCFNFFHRIFFYHSSRIVCFTHSQLQHNMWCWWVWDAHYFLWHRDKIRIRKKGVKKGWKEWRRRRSSLEASRWSEECSQQGGFIALDYVTIRGWIIVFSMEKCSLHAFFPLLQYTATATKKSTKICFIVYVPKVFLFLLTRVVFLRLGFNTISFYNNNNIIYSFV